MGYKEHVKTIWEQGGKSDSKLDCAVAFQRCSSF